MKQYELWWATFPPSIGRRPVLLLSRTPAYEYLTHVLVAEITTRVRGIPQEVPLRTREGLTPPCVANLDRVQLVSKSALTGKLGELAPSRVVEVKRALGYALDLPELKAL
jgi:mRNA-degrading endonuclease toxin of MazEF toxin-antitoxin module